MKIKLAQGALAPTYSTQGAAGADLYANITGPLWIAPGGFAEIPTGVSLELEPGTFAQVKGRSGLAFGRGIMAFDGTVDEDYRGEIKVLLYNFGRSPIAIYDRDRIAQLVITPYVRATFTEGQTTETARGANGFGSTGI